jgi:hypothetical protein
MFQTNLEEKITTHILYSITFFFGNHAIYEIMWKNVEADGPEMTSREHALCTLDN